MHEWQTICWGKWLFFWDLLIQSPSPAVLWMCAQSQLPAVTCLYFPLTGAAGDNFSLSSDCSAGKSTRPYCLTWLSLPGICGIIFLCFESHNRFFFLPCRLALNVKPSAEMEISPFSMFITLRMQKQRRGSQSWPYQTLRSSRHAWNKKFVILYLGLNYFKLVGRRCKKQSRR